MSKKSELRHVPRSLRDRLEAHEVWRFLEQRYRLGSAEARVSASTMSRIRRRKRMKRLGPFRVFGWRVPGTSWVRVGHRDDAMVVLVITLVCLLQLLTVYTDTINRRYSDFITIGTWVFFLFFGLLAGPRFGARALHGRSWMALNRMGIRTCEWCGYDCRSTVDEHCPECGVSLELCAAYDAARDPGERRVIDAG